MVNNKIMRIQRKSWRHNSWCSSSKLNVYMFLLTNNQIIKSIDVGYGTCLINHHLKYSYVYWNYKKILSVTDTIPGVEEDCGGGGRRCSYCYCTTAAIILSLVCKNALLSNNLSKNALDFIWPKTKGLRRHKLEMVVTIIWNL